MKIRESADVAWENLAEAWAFVTLSMYGIVQKETDVHGQVVKGIIA